MMMMISFRFFLLCALFLRTTIVATTQEQQLCANVTDVTATKIVDEDGNNDSSLWTFYVSVTSQETGWDKYANEWRVISCSTSSSRNSSPSREVLGTRVLAHPHVTEQPFTRSHRIEIPNSVEVVLVEAQDSVLGYCGNQYEYALNPDSNITSSCSEISCDGCTSNSNSTTMSSESPSETPTNNSTIDESGSSVGPSPSPTFYKNVPGGLLSFIFIFSILLL